MIEIKNLTKKFGEITALDNLSFNVSDGTVFGLVGSNGAGKSTLLRVLSGVFQADGGEVFIDGENVFENRFGLVPELKKMGADINVQNNHTAIICGVEKLYGADVFACDLRAGAALVVAGLVAEGYTTVYNIDYIDRGYEKIEEVFKSLGADITRG